jgi:hypothetical protein
LKTAPSIQNNDSKRELQREVLHTIVTANHVGTADDVGVARKMDQPGNRFTQAPKVWVRPPHLL